MIKKIEYNPKHQAITDRWRASIMAANESRDTWVSWPLAERMILHILANHEPGDHANAALILLVTGPFGVGKTVTIRECLHRLGITPVSIQGSELESPRAGEPAERLERLYLNAGRTQEETKQLHALLIDDIDMAIGVHKSFNNGTTNLMHVISALMGLADHPTEVRGHRCGRVCVFMTANAADRIYGALTSPHRCRVVEYNPAGEQRTHIAKHILRGVLDAPMIDRVLARTETWTLAHFGALRTAVRELTMFRRYGHIEPKHLMQNLLSNPSAMSLGRQCTTFLDWPAVEHLVNTVSQHHATVRVDHTNAKVDRNG
jgi:SpoVK/Ycf46/Vps4 family AAA+-type ATPase